WEDLRKNYVKATCAGLLKIFSKMGISPLQSHHGAQIFEVLGLDKSLVATYFRGSVPRIGGLTLDDIAPGALSKHWLAFGRARVEQKLLPEGGIYQWKRRGERHLWSPETVHLLQKACRTTDYESHKQYAAIINNQKER